MSTPVASTPPPISIPLPKPLALPLPAPSPLTPLAVRAMIGGGGGTGGADSAATAGSTPAPTVASSGPVPPLRLGGGFVLYRVALCSAECAARCDTIDMGGGGGGGGSSGAGRSDLQWRVRQPTLHQWRQMRLAGARGDPLPAHSDRCRLVLAKTTTVSFPYPEQLTALRWELTLLRRAEAAATTAVATTATAASAKAATGVATPGAPASASPSMDSLAQYGSLGRRLSSSGSTGSGSSRHRAISPFESRETRKLGATVPSLLSLPDGRLALVQADRLGPTLERHLARTRAFIVSFAVHSQLAPTETQQPSALPPTPQVDGGHGSSSSSSSSSSGSSFGNWERRSGPTSRSVTLVQLCHFVAELRRVLNIIISIAMALQKLHAAGVVHKSMRPSNIVLPLSAVDPSVRADDEQMTFASAAAFVDLGAASMLSHDKPKGHLDPHSTPLSIWLYRAPEQSGRTRSTVDNRTDLYTLGVIMYELMCGHTPFSGAGDASEAIHQHMARAPASLLPAHMSGASHPARHAMLTALNSIIMRLLQKQAEHRYQSLDGLLFDLQHVATVLAAEGHMFSESNAASTPFASALADFQIGARDCCGSFRLSQKLYGREEEMRQLLDVLQQLQESGRRCAERARRYQTHAILQQPVPSERASPTTPSVSPCTIMLIRGATGSGKSSLCDELGRSVVRRRGLFARAQLAEDQTPSWAPVMQALRDFMLHLLTFDGILWRMRLLHALDAQACSLLAHSMPELDSLLGPLPPVPKLSPQDRQTRTRLAIVQLVAALSTPDTPLCLCIDDLHLAHVDTLRLLQQMLVHVCGQQQAYLLLICTYRPVDAAHPLTDFIHTLKSSSRNHPVSPETPDSGRMGSRRGSGASSSASTSAPSSSASPTPQPLHSHRVLEMNLEPLHPSHIAQLLLDSFPRSNQPFESIANILQSKTQGSPMLLHLLLHGFYQQRLLSFDYASGEWQWDMHAMARTDVPADVADMLCAHMTHLSQSLQDILQYAALVGPRFSMHTLHIVMQLTRTALATGVCALEEKTFLVCTAGANQLLMLCDAAEDPAAASTRATESSEPSEPSATDPAAAELEDGTGAVRLAELHLMFAHDKIQSAALKLIPPERLGPMHLWVAHRLLSLSAAEMEESAREILRHLVRGRSAAPRLFSSLFAQHADRLRQLVGLATLAGQQALKAGEAHAARDFFTAALQLLEHLVAFQPASPCSSSSSLPPSTDAPSVSISASAPPLSTPPEGWTNEAEAETGAGAGGVGQSPKFPSDDTAPIHYSLVHPLHSNFIRVSESAWRYAYEQTLSLYAQLGPVLLLTESLVEAQGVFEYVHMHARSVVDMAPFFAINIAALRQQNRLTEALLCSLQHAEEIGISFVQEPSDELRRFVRPTAPLPPGQMEFDGAALAQHPICAVHACSDPLALVSMGLLSNMVPVLAHIGSPLFVRVGWTMLDLVRQHGGCSEASVGVSLAAVDAWQRDDLQLAAYLAQLAIHLVRWDDECSIGIKGFVYTLCFGRIYPWFRSFRDCTSLVASSCDEMQTAQSEANVSGFLSAFLVMAGLPLDLALSQLQVIRDRHAGWKSPQVHAHSHVWLRLAQRLHCEGPAGDEHPMRIEWRAGSDRVSDAQLAHEFEMDNNMRDCWVALLTRGIASFYEGDVPHATRLLRRAYELLHKVPAFGSQSALYLYLCLCLCESCPRVGVESDEAAVAALSARSGMDRGRSFDPTRPLPPPAEAASLPLAYDPQEAERTLQLINELIERMSVWARACPVNYQHKLRLMQAERARFCMRSHWRSHHLALPAMHAYQDATELARRHGFLLEFALSTERQSALQRECSRDQSSRFLLVHTYSAYTDAGCLVKLRAMESEWPQLKTVLTVRSEWQMSAFGQSVSAQSAPAGESELTMLSGVAPSGTLQVLVPAKAAVASVADCNAAPFAQTAQSFDMFSVLKATASFSTEKDQSKLLKKLMALMIESAGASRGVLVLRPQAPIGADGCVTPLAAEDNADMDSRPVHRWSVELEARVDNGTGEQEHARSLSRTGGIDTRGDENKQGQVESGDHMHGAPSGGDFEAASWDSDEYARADSRIHIAAPLDRRIEDVLPASVLHYVVAAKEVLVLTEPELESTAINAIFARDPYFRHPHHHPKAILCAPLLRANQVYGSLYLENSVHSGAFTSSHIQLLQLLCSQAALSIDNARLYARLQHSHANLEQLVEHRTAELVDKNEALQRAMKEAEKAAKIKSEFLSSMSHELRTPMNAVLGLSRLLADTPLQEEQRSYCTMITNSGHLLLTIISDILDFSKIEAGLLQLEVAPHNLLEIVETAALLCCNLATAKGLDIGWFVDPSLPPSLAIDSTRVQQILLNLLSNAIKFTRRGSVNLSVTGRPLSAAELNSAHLAGKIPLPPDSAARDADDETPPPSTSSSWYSIHVSVRDTGIGISKDNIKKLFQSVEAMGGSFSVTSVVNQGSEFSFYILSAASAPSPSAPNLYGLTSSELVQLTSIRVLLISGREARSRVFVQLLEHFGSSVHRADSLEASLTLLRGHRPHLSVASRADSAVAPSSAVPFHVVLVDSNSSSDTLVSEHEESLRRLQQAYPHAQFLFLLEAKGQHRTTDTLDPADVQGDNEAATTATVSALVSTDPVADVVTPPRTPRTPPSDLNSLTLVGARSLHPHPHRRSASISTVITTPPAESASGLSSLVPPALSLQSAVDGRSVSSPPADQTAPSPPVALVLPMSPPSHGHIRPPSAPLEFGRINTLTKPFPSAELLRQVLQAAQQCQQRQRPGDQSLSSSASEEQQSSSSLSSSDAAAPSFSSASASSSSSSLLAPVALSRTSLSSTSTSAKIVNIAHQHPLHIMLVEDNIINQKVMLMMLRKLGYTGVLVADQGQQALDLLERQRAKPKDQHVDTILMDASMDVMDGLECTKLIRERQQAEFIRPFIIAQTANASADFAARCKAVGCDHFLTKPIRLEALSDALLAAHRTHHPPDTDHIAPHTRNNSRHTDE